MVKGDGIRKELVKFDVINDNEDKRNRNDGRKNDRKRKTTIMIIMIVDGKRYVGD